jgi:hypothetical protein
VCRPRQRLLDQRHHQVWHGAELIEMERASMLRVATAGVMNAGCESMRLERRSKQAASKA